MPIPNEELKLNVAGQTPAFLVLGADATVAEALGQLPRRRSQRAYVYVIVPLAPRSFLVPRWNEVELLALAAGRDITAMRIADLPSLLGGIDPSIEVDAGGKKIRAGDLPQRFAPVPAAEQDDLSLAQARTQRDAQPASRLVVLNAGQVHGLYVRELLSGSGLPSDPFEAGPAVLGPTTGLPPVLGPTDPGAGASPESAPQVDSRTVNGWIEGWSRDAAGARAWRDIAKDEPLLVGETYELKINVDMPRANAVFSSRPVNTLVERMKPDQEELTIRVELVVDETEFRLYDEAPGANLIMTRAVRPSKNRVTFSLEPLKVGQLTIKVGLFAFREQFQEIEIKVTATDKPAEAVPGAKKGAIASAARGLELAAALSHTRHADAAERVSLYIVEQQTGYQFILSGATVMRANVRLDKESIRSALANARKEFHDKFILKKADGVWVYLEPDPTIPDEIYQADLDELSWIGRDLYQTVFYGRLGEKTPDAALMGDRIRELSKTHTLDIKIVADRFQFPWQLMYDRPDDGSAVDPDGFWGFKHIVQYMPEFSAGGLVGFGNEITCDGKLPVAVVYDERIDAQFGFPVIADQRALFGGSQDIAVKELTKTSEVMGLFRDQDAPPVIYCYIHNVSLFPAEADKKRPELPVGTDGSAITTSEGEVLLRDIKRRASVELPPFKNAPLIFLNACQGAELQPGQFDGVLPYLMQRGARGAIGTEVNTPVNFAAKFGSELVAEFAKGQKTLGELLLERRRFYRDTHKNIMGLIYACYSSGDLIVARG